MSTSLPNLFHDLDDAIPFCLRRIADHYEEIGDTRMAKAWRHMAEDGYVPGELGVGQYAWWVSGKTPTSRARNVVPLEIYYLSQRGRGQHIAFPSMSEAYTWLADLVAKWKDSQISQ